MFKSERDLQEDLARHLRECGYLTFTELEIKSSRGGRADIVAVKPSYANKDCRIYEVKNNRSVFDNDGKIERYLDVCHRFYIACPSGMIKKSELPDNIGLITRSDKGWRVVKSPIKNNPPNFNIDFVLSLLYRGYEETKAARCLRARINLEDNVKLSCRARNIGADIARRLDKDRESRVEEWVSDCGNLFEKYLGIDSSSIGRNKGLPDLYEIEHILASLDNIAKDIGHIRAIGNYLRNLDLPETHEREWRSRQKYRNEAMKLKKDA